MADIFISYKKEDAGRVDRIVEGLRAEGFTVWWDHAIAPGTQWDQTIQTELNAAKMVIAVWSELSVHAPWVKEEAGVGKAKGKLLPVRIDNVDPPLGFGLIQMADLVGWTGDRTDNAQWDHFLGSVRAVMTGQAVAAPERPVKRTSMVGALVALAVLGVAVAGAAVWAFVLRPGQTAASVSVASGAASGAAVTSPSGPVAAAPAPGQPAPASPEAMPAGPSPAEQQLFDKARESRLKSDYLDYLKVWPQGAYARQVREEILPFCTQEKQDYWSTQKTGQSIAGSVDKGYPTEAEACAAAKASAKQNANTSCTVLGNSVDSRNPVLEMKWTDCNCHVIGDGTHVCSTLPSFACTWEYKTFRYVDVCE